MIGAITAGLFDTAVAASTNSFESIATVTVGSGGQSSISFSSIPSTYKHLQIRAIAQDSATNPPYNAGLTFNSDSGSNYAVHWIAGDGATASSFANYNTTYIEFGYLNSYTTATSYSACVIDILDYADTNKYKTSRMLQGYDKNGSGRVDLTSGLWRSTSAISTITISSLGTSLRQYSHFALYGIRG